MNLGRRFGASKINLSPALASADVRSKVVVMLFFIQSKGAKIKYRYNQVPHLTQDTNGKVTNSQLDTTNESQEGSPFPAGDHKAHTNKRAQNIANTRQKNTKDPQTKYRLGTVSIYFTGELKPVSRRQPHP